MPSRCKEVLDEDFSAIHSIIAPRRKTVATGPWRQRRHKGKALVACDRGKQVWKIRYRAARPSLGPPARFGRTAGVKGGRRRCFCQIRATRPIAWAPGIVRGRRAHYCDAGVRLGALRRAEQSEPCRRTINSASAK